MNRPRGDTWTSPLDRLGRLVAPRVRPCCGWSTAQSSIRAIGSSAPTSGTDSYPSLWTMFPNALSTAIQYASLNFPANEGLAKYNGLQICWPTSSPCSSPRPLAFLTGLLQAPAVAARFGTRRGPLNRQVARPSTSSCFYGMLVFIRKATAAEHRLVFAHDQSWTTGDRGGHGNRGIGGCRRLRTRSGGRMANKAAEYAKDLQSKVTLDATMAHLQELRTSPMPTVAPASPVLPVMKPVSSMWLKRCATRGSMSRRPSSRWQSSPSARSR